MASSEAVQAVPIASEFRTGTPTAPSSAVEPHTPTPVSVTPASEETVKDDAVTIEVSSASAARAKRSEGAEKESAPIDSEVAEQLAEKISKSLRNGTEVHFDVHLHDRSQNGNFLSAFQFQVIDKDTGEVVRQFPPEEIIKLQQKFERASDPGTVLNKRV